MTLKTLPRKSENVTILTLLIEFIIKMEGTSISETLQK